MFVKKSRGVLTFFARNVRLCVKNRDFDKNCATFLIFVIPLSENYAKFSVLSKFVFMFDMLAGRLEIFPMLILFAPTTWRK